MKSVVLLVGTLALVLMASPASAAIILDFGTGLLGSSGACTITATTASCTGVGIGVMTVIGDGAANGTYLVDGGTQGVEGGTLSFSVSTTSPATDTLTITGSIDCAVGFTGGLCSAADNTANKELVATSILASGSGFSGVTITGAGTPTAEVFFASASDSKSLALLTALGITPVFTCSGTPSMCPGWSIDGFSISAQNPTGAGYTAFSTDVADVQQVPEPASILLLGTMLVGVTQLVRRRVKA